MKKEFIDEIMAKEIKRIISESVSEVYIIKNIMNLLINGKL